MKLFISKEVLSNIGEKVKIRALDEKRTQITILNVSEKNDGTREVTPFNFKIPINKKFLEQSKENILLDVYGLVLTHKNEKKVENDKVNTIYAILYQGKLHPAEIYIPVERKDRIKVLYKIQNEDEMFYIISLNLSSKKETFPIFLAHEAKFLVEKMLLFKLSYENKLDVTEVNTYFNINKKNQILYLPLHCLGKQTID